MDLKSKANVPNIKRCSFVHVSHERRERIIWHYCVGAISTHGWRISTPFSFSCVAFWCTCHPHNQIAFSDRCAAWHSQGALKISDVIRMKEISCYCIATSPQNCVVFMASDIFVFLELVNGTGLKCGIYNEKNLKFWNSRLMNLRTKINFQYTSKKCALGKNLPWLICQIRRKNFYCDRCKPVPQTCTFFYKLRLNNQNPAS